MCLNSPSHGLALKKRCLQIFRKAATKNYAFYLEYANILKLSKIIPLSLKK